MSVLDRKLRRDLRSSLGLLLAIVSIVAVGVTCYVSTGASYRNLQDAKARYYADCRMADFSIEVKKVPLAELRALAAMPGVAEIRPRIQFFATVDLPEAKKPLNGLVLSLPDRREPCIDDIVLRRGGYFTDERENQVIVNETFAAKHGLCPGQWIHLVLNNRQQELFIVGTAISSEFVYLLGPGSIVPDPEHFGVFYLKQTYAEDVFDFDGAANQVLGLMSPELRDRPDAMLREAERLLEPYGVYSTTPRRDQASNLFITNEIEGLASFAVVMPAIFLGVAATVLNVLLSRLAEQQRTVVGTLKAMGYTDGQIFLHFLQFGLTMGLVGGLLGCVCGHYMADTMILMYKEFFEFPDLANRPYWDIFLIGMGISLGCAALGSLRGARSVLRLKPAEAMRPKPPKTGRAVLLERIAWIWNRLSTSWRMVVRSLFRNRMRTAVSIFAAAMGAAVLSSGFMMVQGGPFLLDFQFRRILQSDVDLTFKDEQGEEAVFDAAQLPGVDRVEPVLDVACTFYHGAFRKKGAISGLSAGARLTVPRDLDGRPVRIPEQGLAMTRAMADLLHVKQGDWVVFEPTKGVRDPIEAPVLEIAESYLGTAVYADIHYLSRLVGEELAVTGVQLATDRDPEKAAALNEELKTLPCLQGVAYRADSFRNFEKTLVEHVQGFIFFLVAFSGVVFLGSILTASLISLAERQREVATLRVLGYGPWQIGGLLFRETMITTALGTLVGMPLGYLLTALTAVSYESELFRFPVVSTPGTWIWTAVCALVFALFAHLCVQRVIHRMNWLEALQAKE